MNDLIQVKQTQVPYVWEEAEKYLVRAMQDERTITNTKARVFAGLDNLWAVADKDGEPLAWATTLLYTEDGVKVTAQIRLAATDDMKLFVEKMPEFERWAHEKGAHFIEVVGRKGWEKVLKSDGFTFNYTSLVKRVYKELH